MVHRLVQDLGYFEVGHKLVHDSGYLEGVHRLVQDLGYFEVIHSLETVFGYLEVVYRWKTVPHKLGLFFESDNTHLCVLEGMVVCLEAHGLVSIDSSACRGICSLAPYRLVLLVRLWDFLSTSETKENNQFLV